MNAYSRLVGSSKRVPVQHLADGGPVGYGAKGLAGLRDMIPTMQAMGYPQAAAASAAGPRSPAALKAMIPRVESMGYQQAASGPRFFADGGLVTPAQRRGAAWDRLTQSNADRYRSLSEQADVAQAEIQEESLAQQQRAEDELQDDAIGNPQQYADGGFVKTIQRLVGMDPERNARIASYKAQTAAERQAAPPAPAPAPAPAISDYSNMSAAQRREKAAGLNNGGQVRGPGTGTSDSIPAMLSNGEFVLPADTVRKVGVSALERLVGSTHKPVNKPAKQHHYASGGLVDDPRKPNSFGDQAAATREAGVTVLPNVAAAPAVPSLDSRVASIPSGPQAVPTPAADGSQSSFSNTEVGRNVTNTLSAIPGLGGVGRVASTGGAVSGSLNALSRLANSTAAVGVGAAAVPSLVSAADSMPTTTVTPLTRPSAGRPADRTPAVDTSDFTMAPSNQVTRVGNSYSGGNVGSGFSIGGDGPRGGQISAQNMSAAERLAGTSQAESLRRLGLDQGPSARAGGPGSGPVAPGSFTGGFTGVIGPTDTYGNMRGRTPEQQRRDAEVSASSITNTLKWGGPDAGNSAAMQGYRAAIQQGSDIRQNEAAAGREVTRQAGENDRARLMGQRYDATNQLESRRLGLQETAAGYQNRSADRLDRAQQDLERATTPEARTSARERLMGLAGKTDNEWRLQVTPTTKNADGSTTEGSVVRYNQRTGAAERVNMGQGAAQASQFEIGKTYVDGNGKRAKYTEKGWQPA